MDHTAATTVAVTIGATGLLVMILAVPLLQRRVKPNRYYGFRTPATLADEGLWYEVNAKTGLDLLVVGAGQLLVALLFVLGFLPVLALAVLMTVWLLGGLLFSLIHGLRITRDWKNR